MNRYNWMKIMDVMTRNPLVMTPDETVDQAEELMTENRIRQLPVVEGGTLLGIVTDRDLRSFLAGPGFMEPEEHAKALKTRVGEIMTSDPLTVAPDDELREAVELLIEEKIGGLPVVDQAEGLVGIVTHSDLLRCFLHRIEEDA